MNNKTENRCTEIVYRRSVQAVLHKRVCTGVLYRRSVQDFNRLYEAVQTFCTGASVQQLLYRSFCTERLLQTSCNEIGWGKFCTGVLYRIFVAASMYIWIPVQTVCTGLYRPSVQAFCTGVLYRPVSECSVTE